MPGGSSTAMLGPEHLSTPLDAESLQAVGSVPGSGGVIVLHNRVCIVAAIQRISEFYRNESCGKCTSCREGTYWLTSILERLEHGQGKKRGIDLLLDICSNISGKSFCALGDFATGTLTSSIKLFRTERLPELVQSYAHMTNRLRQWIEAIGRATSGEVGAWLAEHLGMDVSLTTILRRLMALFTPPVGTVYNHYLTVSEEDCLMDSPEKAYETPEKSGKLREEKEMPDQSEISPSHPIAVL